MYNILSALEGQAVPYLLSLDLFLSVLIVPRVPRSSVSENLVCILGSVIVSLLTVDLPDTLQTKSSLS